MVQWRGRSSCRGDAEAGSAGLSATSRHWLARSARGGGRRVGRAGRVVRRGIVAANNSLVSLTPRFHFGFRLNGVTIKLFKLSRHAVSLQSAWSMSPTRRVLSNFVGSQSWEGRYWVLHVHACTASALACARAAHRAASRCTLHAPLSRNSPPHLSHAPLPRASPTRLSHAPSTRLSHVPRSGGAGQAAQLQ